MNRTVLAVIVLAVIVGIAAFLFYDGSDANQGETVIDKADQTTPPPGAAPAAP